MEFSDEVSFIIHQFIRYSSSSLTANCASLASLTGHSHSEQFCFRHKVLHNDTHTVSHFHLDAHLVSHSRQLYL